MISFGDFDGMGEVGVRPSGVRLGLGEVVVGQVVGGVNRRRRRGVRRGWRRRGR